MERGQRVKLNKRWRDTFGEYGTITALSGEVCEDYAKSSVNPVRQVPDNRIAIRGDRMNYSCHFALEDFEEFIPPINCPECNDRYCAENDYLCADCRALIA